MDSTDGAPADLTVSVVTIGSMFTSPTPVVSLRVLAGRGRLSIGERSGHATAAHAQDATSEWPLQSPPGRGRPDVSAVMPVTVAADVGARQGQKSCERTEPRSGQLSTTGFGAPTATSASATARGHPPRRPPRQRARRLPPDPAPCRRASPDEDQNPFRGSA